MHSAPWVGLRLAGLLAIAVVVAHCGESNNHTSTGGVNPSAGAFTGTTREGGVMTIHVGSIDSISLDCDGETLVETFSPPAPIASDGTFSVTIRDRGAIVHVSGTFTDDDSVDGTVDDESNDCDTTFAAVRVGVATARTATPTPTQPPTSITETETPTEVTPTPSATETGETPTATGPTVTGVTVTPTPHCPTKLTVTGLGSQADLDTGWTGIAHDQKVVDMGALTLALAGCQGQPTGSGNGTTCGVCNITGPAESTTSIDNHRCARASQTTCTGDGECGANGPCAFFFGAPLPLSSGGVSVCVTNRVKDNIVTGTVNTASGDSTAALSLIASVFNQAVDNDVPCPQCNSGKCLGGSRAGASCTVHGSSTFFGHTSFDCPPDPTAIIVNLTVPFNTTTGQTKLSHTAAACVAFPDKSCVGGANDGQVCGQASVCPGGTCTGNRCFCPGQAHPNQCDGGICTDPDGTGGLCQSGPFDQFCSIKPWVGCAMDSECAAVDAGNCQGAPVQRPCFGQTDQGVVPKITGDIVRNGHPSAPNANGLSTSTVAATFCLAQTGARAVDNTAGLPGPGAIVLPTQSQLFQ